LLFVKSSFSSLVKLITTENLSSFIDIHSGVRNSAFLAVGTLEKLGVVRFPEVTEKHQVQLSISPLHKHAAALSLAEPGQMRIWAEET
jgi:hypothetical protein